MVGRILMFMGSFGATDMLSRRATGAASVQTEEFPSSCMTDFTTLIATQVSSVSHIAIGA